MQKGSSIVIDELPFFDCGFLCLMQKIILN